MANKRKFEKETKTESREEKLMRKYGDAFFCLENFTDEDDESMDRGFKVADKMREFIYNGLYRNLTDEELRKAVE